MWTQHFSLILFLNFLLQTCAANFTFTYSEATQCDDFQVSWTGGTPPFYLTIIPAFAVQSKVAIADSSFNNNHGVFSTPMTFPADKKIVVVMSDATGFGSGGVSPVITVGKPVNNGYCSANDFDFTNDDALTQCTPYHITNYNYGKAVEPVQLTGVVPGGSTFVLNVPKGTNSYTWGADVAAGTQLILMMTDAIGKQGGNTDIMVVAQSLNTSCLDNNSPASATNAPSLTSASGTISPTSNNSSPSSSSSASRSDTTPSSPSRSDTSSSRTGTLVAAIVAPVVGVTVLVVGAFIWCRRRRDRGVRVLGSRFQDSGFDLTKDDRDTSVHMGEIVPPTSAVPLLRDRSPGADGATALGNYSPRLPSSASQDYQHGAMSAYRPSHDSSSQSSGTPVPAVAYARGISTSARSGDDSLSGWRSKAAEANVLVPPGHQPPAQFILHTDLEDSIAPPTREVIELPPQYSERRATQPNDFR
ncbi:hypothetical protein L226DRAFT_566214 [Lentinus tigrinus ALCF2SS1-7]|uniref:uncharacterized protein n=1 Tax=Lentinus tigrinus ALCF2SS1-7 TaxID=1328758 RepID=UPI001165DD19|nr:hypothetical protein L226DRAFT_566214 [Lentinus tigrinus ALCF2SS1-7]